ncbi:MAG: AAA family ATPase [Candidatus Bathyarchaeia archaeon]
MASTELEQFAVKYAREAINSDTQGSKSMAIAKYQQAIEVLLRLCSLYPNAPQNRVYMERIDAYRKRVNELKTGVSRQELSDHSPPAKFEQLVLSEKPNVKWGDIADLEDAKRAIQESIIYPVKRPDLFPLGWPTGILLFGPPGCGKTLLAAAVATEIDAVFYCIDAASVMSKWLGESEKNVAQLFESAEKASARGQPAIIFIDEIDSLVGVRSEEVGGEARMRNQFLTEMDNVSNKNKRQHIYVIGATNKPWALDLPFIRRFQKRIYVPLPDHQSRLEIFKIYLKNLRCSQDVDLVELSKMMEGYSGSDIRDIFQSVHIKTVREFFESNDAGKCRAQPREIKMSDFMEILRERKPSVSQEVIKSYTRWFEEFKAL